MAIHTPPDAYGVHVVVQWGTVAFHRLSLQNLNEAMRKTRKLCAVMLDTTGREIMVMREHEIDEKGWPEHVNNMEVKEGQKVQCYHHPYQITPLHTLYTFYMLC